MKLSKEQHKLCVECKDHRAMFRFWGKVKRDDNHTLCFRCYRSLSESWRARRLAGLGL